MLSTIRRPTPGTANTVSVITAPPSSSPMCSPTIVTVAMIAFRRMWRPITSEGRRPLARAKSTKSAVMIVRIDARRLRISTAESDSASVSAGRMRW